MARVNIDDQVWETVRVDSRYELKITVPERTGDDTDAKAMLRHAEREKKGVDEDIVRMQARSAELQTRIDGLNAILRDLGA